MEVGVGVPEALGVCDVEDALGVLGGAVVCDELEAGLDDLVDLLEDDVVSLLVGELVDEGLVDDGGLLGGRGRIYPKPIPVGDVMKEAWVRGELGWLGLWCLVVGDGEGERVGVEPVELECVLDVVLDDVEDGFDGEGDDGAVVVAVLALTDDA